MADKRSRGSDSLDARTGKSGNSEHRADSMPTSDQIKQELDDYKSLPASKYPGLKSASKRKRSIDSADSKSDLRENDKSTTSKARQRPFAPPLRLKSQRKPLTNKTVVDTRLTQHEASWYREVDLRQMWKRSELQTLSYTLELIRKGTLAIKTGDNEEVAYSILRRRIHQMEFYDFITDVLIVKSKLLEDQGFPAIYNNAAFPWDLRADALLLYKKWCAHQWDPDLLRGIVTKKGTTCKDRSVSTRAIEKDYPHKIGANYVGAGELINGQWWPLQMCTIRDGAHGTPEGGIYGQVKKGAYSIILSGGGYADIDEGDEIKYCGISGEENKPTAFTERMLESSTLKNPIRVLRSAALAGKHSIYRPTKGLRYDGIYEITGYELLDKGTAMHRFTLRRCDGQDPIRYEGEEARPTEEELRAFEKIQAHLGSHE